MSRLWAELPDLWASVDPGERNVGLSMWHGPVCMWSDHSDPDSTIDLLITEIHKSGLSLVTYEKFVLRPSQMGVQHGNEMFTSQMIGAMRHICRRAGVDFVGYRPRDHKALFKQKAFRPPDRPLNEWASFGRGGHAKDSENVGEYHVRKVMLKGKGY